MSSPCTLAIALVLLTSSQALAQLRLNDCRVSGEPIRCGTLRVPENRATSAGRQLTLSIMLAPHSGSVESKEPLFVLKGGPGERATADVEHTLGMFRSLRRDHDLVLLDQRGSGGENRLQCDVADHTFLVPRDPERCLRDLSAKADLRQYTTEHFVQDLEAAREALGYEQISLWAGSYGTRAAYVYAKRYPQRVRSLVLIAAAPMSMPVLDTFGEEGRIALDALIADCMADRACAGAFPNLRMDVKKVRDGVLDPFEQFGLQMLQYSARTSRLIPLLMKRAAAGDREPLQSAITQVRQELAARLALGLNLAVFCSEDVPFVSSQGVDAQSVLRVEYQRACRGWPRAELPDDFRASVRLDRPTLLISGEWDPVTSPRWARVAADQFSRSQVVVVAKEGHTLDGLDSCVGAMTREFLDTGHADSSCAIRPARPPYAVRP
jgi:pimeloyl-ACP methyl ester carboxylesterase